MVKHMSPTSSLQAIIVKHMLPTSSLQAGSAHVDNGGVQEQNKMVRM